MNSFGDGSGLFRPGNQGLSRRLFLGLEDPSISKSTVHRGFEDCLSRIELNTTRVKEASQHYNAVKSWLESKLSVTVRQVGSFQRSTKIRPIVEEGAIEPIDIDAIVCFGDAYAFVDGGITCSMALQWVNDSLTSNTTYGLLKPEIDNPVVTLSYKNEFYIELIPCYRNRIGAANSSREPASYLVANGDGLWEEADYDFDSEFITAANKRAGKKLVPAIKLVKRFIRNNGIPLKSFQIEVLCALILGPFFEGAAQNQQNWEWQDSLYLFMKMAPAVLDANPTLPGSKSICQPTSNLVSTQRQLIEWAGVFDELRDLPDTKERYDIYRKVYGAPYPARV